MKRVIASLVCCTALGCGGPRTTETTVARPVVEAAPAGPVAASGAEQASASVGEAGGTLSLTNGARLTIPRGALPTTTDVTFGRGVDGQAFSNAESQRPLGPMLNVTPALRAASGHFEVSIPRQSIPSGFEEADLAFGMEEVDDQQRAIDVLGTQTRWQFYPVQIEGDRFVARVDGLPGHRLHFGVSR